MSACIRLVAMGLLMAPVAAAGQTPAGSQSTSPLRITAVDVQPAVAAPDTLARLKVRIRNAGTEPASSLTFDVTVSGQRLAPYLNHVFLTALEPGKETDVPLYNFWTSESGRPFPKDGRLVVEVRLTGAAWAAKGGGGARGIKPMPPPLAVTLAPRKAP